MVTTFKKVVFAFLLLLVVTSTGAWQSSKVSAAAGIPETPLMSGLKWKDLGQSVRNIQLNIKGDALELSGQTFQAVEKFAGEVPQQVSDYYSNVPLYRAGWVSDNAYEAEDGLHQVFYHRSGIYLAIDFVKCADDAESTCVIVWKSAHKDTAKLIEGKNVQSQQQLAGDPMCVDPTAEFCKNKNYVPNGATNINPTSVYLSWSQYLPAQKYSYCIKEYSACAANDPNWTGTFLNQSIVKTNLNFHKIYFWQVKAITCGDCLPKEFVLADNAAWWQFTTTLKNVTISGNAGVVGATLKWVDTDKVTKSTTSNSSGNYTISVPTGWTGKITPSKTSYTFQPVSRTYSTGVTENKTSQNFIATETRYKITGTVKIGLAKLSYFDGVAKSVIADPDGNYTISVPVGWTGSVTPSSDGVYMFFPTKMTYTALKSDMPAQDYEPGFLAVITSNPRDDGYIRETNEFSGIGGGFVSNETVLRVGDTELNQQKRSIVSFNTGNLPAGAVIKSASLRLKYNSVTGANPINTHGWLVFDLRKGFFGASRLLEASDFESISSKDFAGWLSKTPVNGFYSGAIIPSTLKFINLTGVTQLRLRFQTDDNNNNVDDSVLFYSGNDLVVSNRPRLEIVYIVP